MAFNPSVTAVLLIHLHAIRASPQTMIHLLGTFCVGCSSFWKQDKGSLNVCRQTFWICCTTHLLCCHRLYSRYRSWCNQEMNLDLPCGRQNFILQGGKPEFLAEHKSPFTVPLIYNVADYFTIFGIYTYVHIHTYTICHSIESLWNLFLFICAMYNNGNGWKEVLILYQLYTLSILL